MSDEIDKILMKMLSRNGEGGLLGTPNEALDEARSAIESLLQEAEKRGRIEERNRVTYEHESFTKELFKDQVLNVKIWWLETAAEAHERRLAELNKEKGTE